jgi:hypothetical protein
MKKLFLVFSIIFIQTSSLFAYDNTQIVATSYSDKAKTYYEIALPYAPVNNSWVSIGFNGVTAIAQVKTTGPNNTYDDYWDAGTNRDMFQNLDQWMPQAEWVHPKSNQPDRLGQTTTNLNFIGVSDFYTNPNNLIFVHQYPDATAGERYDGDPNPTVTPTAIDDLDDNWASSSTNAGIDLSGGVWRHLGEEGDNSNFAFQVAWNLWSYGEYKYSGFNGTWHSV